MRQPPARLAVGGFHRYLPAMPEDVLIRSARSADAAPLAALARRTCTHAFGHSFRPSDLAAHLERTLSVSEALRFEVWEHNYDAQRFYARFGFKVVGTRRFVVDSGDSDGVELLMYRHASHDR